MEMVEADNDEMAMNRRTAASVVVVLGLLLTGCSAGGGVTATPAPAPTPSPAPSSPSSAASSASTPIDHIVVILEENRPATSVIGNAAAPYLNSLATDYAHATNYSAITHPSLPNYLALTSGTTGGITTDCAPGGSCLVSGPNLAGSLQKAGLSWKMYAEGMPGPCVAGDSGRYAVRHNPFMYYPGVTSNPAGCGAHVVPFSQFAADLASPSGLPSFSFISPDLCNDMHSCSIKTGDDWLARNVPQILDSTAFTAQRSLLVVTFDEGDSSDNVVACIFAGPAAQRGAVSSTRYTHYSLLRTIEEGLGLAPLTANDAGAHPMTDMLTGH
jgi:acid phosphatase